MRAVNLLPPDLRSGPKGPAPAVPTGVENSGAGAFVVLGVLAFAVLALAAYILAGNTVKDRQAELARATAESAAVTKQVSALQPYADFETVANARVQTVKDLANSRFDWEQALRDLSRAVPADVTIASFKGDLGSTTAGGGIRGAITAPAITLTGCTYSQTKVATLMARLRNIDGVTRVSLSKSDKEATTAGASADRTAPSATGYCGRNDVPAFELVVFFEGAAAASTAPAPGAAAATTTTSTTPGATASPAPGATPAPAGVTPASTPAPTGATPASTPAATPTPATTTP
ncbi:MAG TPA: PilN domain-containing protein [Solirubrobacteraceae bacterium]|nr:PilN domain-containing protein [Solirubrobacteraceae bacterium]